MALITWYLTLESGIHATLAGVALALITPAHAYYGRREFDRGARAILDQFSVDEEDQIEAQEHSDHEVLLIATVARESVSPLSRLEHALAGWSSFVVVPIFALANAGVDFRGVNIVDSLTAPVALGVATGLIVGKPLGIWVATLIAVRLRLGILPAGMSLRHLFGLGVIAGIGFTVSLFVAGLAYEDPLLRELAKVGIFAGSLVSGLLGALILSRGDRGRPEV
jgi:NhaA family Na+:H+ antiporter